MAKRDQDLEFSMNAAFDDERTTIDKVPLYLINGSLGAGKTSVLEFLLQQSCFKGARVIENEYANENVDGFRLKGLAELVATLSGDCVCCSSKDALTRMLFDFCRHSPAPVFIEATGVARTINLVERLINAKIFDKYELAHSLYVIEAREVLNGPEPSHEIELQAADTILVTKEDLLSEDERGRFQAISGKLPYARVLPAPHGRFEMEALTAKSGLLDFFDKYDGELSVPDNPTYSVIDMTGIKVEAEAYQALWPELFAAYDLRRMKGCFEDRRGRRWHIEATVDQLQISSARTDEANKIVFIGERADKLTRQILRTQLMMFA